MENKIIVIKDVTVLNANRFYTIKAGSISIEYIYCNYHFLDEKGINCYINSVPCLENTEYFRQITEKEIRKLKLKKIDEKINELEEWYSNFVKEFSKRF